MKKCCTPHYWLLNCNLSLYHYFIRSVIGTKAVGNKGLNGTNEVEKRCVTRSQKHRRKLFEAMHSCKTEQFRSVFLSVCLHNNLKMLHVTRQWAAEILLGTWFNPKYMNQCCRTNRLLNFCQLVLSLTLFCFFCANVSDVPYLTFG